MQISGAFVRNTSASQTENDRLFIVGVVASQLLFLHVNLVVVDRLDVTGLVEDGACGTTVPLPVHPYVIQAL